MSDASSHRQSSPNVSNVDHDPVNEQLRRFAAQHNLSMVEVTTRAAVLLALMASGPSPSQSSPREAAPSQGGASFNATAAFPAEPEAKLPANSGPSNAPTSAEPSNAPVESSAANALAGASSPPRLFETLLMAQIDNLIAGVTALNSRMDLMNNRITALEASFNQLNVTRLARPADNREDNQSGGVQSGGLDPRAEMESELVSQILFVTQWMI